jgi:glycosyltransferase involved in cell wall biosynthesis
MNLLVVVPAYEPAWALGGVVRCMSSLCRGLVSLGHQVTVYTTNNDGMGARLSVPCGEPVDQGGVTTYFFPSTFGGSVWDSRALIRCLGGTLADFQLVYVAAVWQWLGIAVSSCCRKHRVPLVMGIHGSLDQALRHRFRWRKNFYWHAFLKRSLAHSAALHLTTDYERGESRDLLSGFASFIVPNGLDCTYFRPIETARSEFRRRFRLPCEAPVAISVGRPDPKKRVDLLIRGLVSNTVLYLLVVGATEGEIFLSWKTLARELGVEDRVIWTGFLHGEELIQAYAAADFFALISEDENFGNVVVEAMACKLPVLVSEEVGVWGEIRTAAAGMALPAKASEVDRGLADFLKQRELWAAWGENGRRLVLERFAADKVAATMAQAFEDVLTGTRTALCRWQEGCKGNNPGCWAPRSKTSQKPAKRSLGRGSLAEVVPYRKR